MNGWVVELVSPLTILVVYHFVHEYGNFMLLEHVDHRTKLPICTAASLQQCMALLYYILHDYFYDLSVTVEKYE